MARFHTHRAAARAYDVLRWYPPILNGRRIRPIYARPLAKGHPESNTSKDDNTDLPETEPSGNAASGDSEVSQTIEDRQGKPVKETMSHYLFLANLPINRELEAAELQKTLEDAGIHDILLVKIREYECDLCVS